MSKLVVGIGGSTRPGSTTEVAIKAVLADAEGLGARTELISGQDLVMPPYEPKADGGPGAARVVRAMREADALVIGSPGYHGSISGLVKNALDYSEELREDPRVYFDGLPVACIATGFGWSGAIHTLGALRDVVHALRGWPTPLGIAINTAEPGAVVDGRIANPQLVEQAQIVAAQLMAFPASQSGA
ncbi:MAG TPA: NAD(P)H-dependent oxidoreductase [Solirubrobacterales bacterium]|nr:NAD(P)H-dependent oxidoreductase [Solirubrobacterales bacterium]